MGARRGTLAAVLFALTLLAAAGRCAAARQLKQDVHSITTKGNNPTAQAGLNLFAKAREAEARANPLSSGLYHGEAKQLVQTGGLYPGPRGSVATLNSNSKAGSAFVRSGSAGAPIAIFGTMVNAHTDTERARAISASEGVMIEAARDGGAQGAGTDLFAQFPVRRASAPGGLALTDSFGVTDVQPRSSGISGVGGGPTAVAAAGEAVAMSYADSLENERRHIQNR